MEPGDPRPVFRQIVDEVQRCMATGILRADDPLPAVRELARLLKVNPNTVQQAYRELERAGAAYVRRGVGTFVGQVARSRMPDGRWWRGRLPAGSCAKGSGTVCSRATW